MFTKEFPLESTASVAISTLAASFTVITCKYFFGAVSGGKFPVGRLISQKYPLTQKPPLKFQSSLAFWSSGCIDDAGQYSVLRWLPLLSSASRVGNGRSHSQLAPPLCCGNFPLLSLA